MRAEKEIFYVVFKDGTTIECNSMAEANSMPGHQWLIKAEQAAPKKRMDYDYTLVGDPKKRLVNCFRQN